MIIKRKRLNDVSWKYENFDSDTPTKLTMYEWIFLWIFRVIFNEIEFWFMQYDNLPWLADFVWSVFPIQGNGIFVVFIQHEPFTDVTSLALLSLSQLLLIVAEYFRVSNFFLFSNRSESFFKQCPFVIVLQGIASQIDNDDDIEFILIDWRSSELNLIPYRIVPNVM